MPCPGNFCEPSDWSRDGSTLLLSVLEAGDWNIWTVPADGSAPAKPLLAAAYSERDPRWSPDGRWLAYVSEEAGHSEVLVHSASGPAKRYVISGEGGVQPVWSRDGNALYFLTLEGNLRRVTVGRARDGEPAFGLPTKLDVPQIGFGHWGTQYDISPDGKRIYFMQPSQDSAPQEIQIAINWQALLD